MSLGTRLRELREAAGLSQDQIAAMAGVSRNAVSQWESDRTKPATNRLPALARALKVGVDDLIAPTSQMRMEAIETALGLFNRLEPDEISLDTISAACGLSRIDFDVIFESRSEFFLEVFRVLEDRKLDEISRAPPIYGTLPTKLKYLLRHFYKHDIEHLNIAKTLQSVSWSWTVASERRRSQQQLRIHEFIVALFDEAAAQGQIDSGNYRAASSLILSAYEVGLRKAVFEVRDPERIISFLEPQLTLILRGFGFRVIPGLAEDGSSGLVR